MGAATATKAWMPDESWINAFSGKGFPTVASKVRKYVASILGQDIKLDSSVLEAVAADFRKVPIAARKGAEAASFLTDFGNKLASTARTIPEPTGLKAAISGLLGFNTGVANKALAEVSGAKTGSKLLGGLGKAGNLAMLALLYKDLLSPTSRGLEQLSASKAASLSPEQQDQTAQDMVNSEIIKVLRQRRMLQDAGQGDSGVINAMAKMQMAQATMPGTSQRVPGAVQI